jgi:predicted lipoprotein with Yx(FWY)xxD motif
MKYILTTLTVLSIGVAVSVTAFGAASASSSIGVRRTQLGRVLVDGRGRTLYLFERDKADKSNCSSGCLAVWPALTASTRPHARAGITNSKIGTIRRADGRRQVTYAKHPLYYYAGDTKPGDTNGQGLNQFGAKWYVLSPTGRKIDND